MGAIAQAVPASTGWFDWLWQFLKDELAPYKGRTELVMRMVFASTLMMVIGMTFRLPYGAYGAIFALTLSRESLESTASAARNMVIGLVLAGAYVIFGMMLALADPALRFAWIVASFFAGFWALSALASYAASARFGYLIAITVTLWDKHISTNAKVESTLWAVGVIILASLVTLLAETVFAKFRQPNELRDAMAERLEAVDALLSRLATGQVDDVCRATVARLAVTGTSRMRQALRRSRFDARHVTEMGAVVALTGRLVDLAANLRQFSGLLPETDRERIGNLEQQVRYIRESVMGGLKPPSPEDGVGSLPSRLPLLAEMERTVSLIQQAFTNSESLSVFAPGPAEGIPSAKPILTRSLLDPEHIRFALRGCLAATSCYLIFNALFWPEISTSVTTCFLTALSTIGASRQKQVLRFAGAIIGGFGIGMGAQVFILPYIDSIAGFTALFVIVVGASAWIATSSPRFSYFGVQIAVAFCLINLQEFAFQTSLTVARDRAVGVLLGLAMMWLFFDQLWSKPAGVEMRRSLMTAVRLFAHMVRGPAAADVREAIAQSYELREAVHAGFDKVRSLADGVLFEFGASRRSDMEFREQIREWQPQLRTLFVMRIASLKYRLRVPGFELPETVRARLAAYDEVSARIMDNIAERIDRRADGTAELHELLGQRLHDTEAEASKELTVAQFHSFVTLLESIDALTRSLSAKIAF